MRFYQTIDASTCNDLVGTIKTAFADHALLVVRNVVGAMGGRLSAYEYSNLMRELGRVWTTADEIAAESKFQLKDHPEIIKLAHNGLLGDKKLPIHSDGSHHPTRPWPARALLPVVLPKDGATTTTFYDMYGVVEEVDAWFYEHDWVTDTNDIICYHKPAYGTGWAGRWNRLFEIHPRTGRRFVAFDETFIRGIRCGDNIWDEDSVVAEKVEIAAIIRQHAISYEHHWQPNDLVIWDNRGLAHSRTAVTSGEHREMWRITFDLNW